MIDYPVKVTMPPALMKGLTGQTYIVAGKWVPVPDNTTREDMHKYVTYNQPTYTNIETWSVKSSKGSTYTVKCYEGKRYSCECAGFMFYKNCKHIKSIKKNIL